LGVDRIEVVKLLVLSDFAVGMV